jgi:hypothetical protein
MRSKPMAALSILFVTCVLVEVEAVHAEKAVQTNLELITQLSTEVVEDLLSDIPREIAPRRVILSPHASDERYEFLTNVFTRTLTANGYRTFSARGGAAALKTAASEDSTGGIMKLEFQAIEFNLSYPKIYRSHLIGGRKVKRYAEVKLFTKLLDPRDEAVVWVGEASRSREDQFPHRLLDYVEAGVFDFNKPPRESTNWGRIVEPVVVGGIIVGLIYLFFSNQSGD